jgi:hypothetical protein
VRKNLFEALVSIENLIQKGRVKELFLSIQYQCRTRCHLLWIDAICIDQTNVKERNAQVQLMPTIYQSAGKVVAWLDKGDQTSDLAIDTMNKKGFRFLFLDFNHSKKK